MGDYTMTANFPMDSSFLVMRMGVWFVRSSLAVGIGFGKGNMS